MPTEIAQKFLDWSLKQLHETNTRTLTIIEEAAETREGRQRIALSYLNPARQRLQFILHGHPPSIIRDGHWREARRLCSTLEELINLFPEEERFNTALMSLREVLIELYSSMSPNYEHVSDPVESETYDGPRPTRFEREWIV
jgi:hypothetical protein